MIEPDQPTDKASSAAVKTSAMSTDNSNITETRHNAAEAKADTEKADTDKPNPLQMPAYDVSRDSKEFKNWRQTQYQHGKRNLLLALLVFGGLALIYWLATTK